MEIELNQILGTGYDKLFICDNGNLISRRQNREIIMKIYCDRKGYCYIKLWNSYDRTFKHYAIHRLVGMAFIPNPNNKPEINHKDRVKSHNWSDNLEWSTRVENVQHADNPVRHNTPCELWYNDQFIKEFESKAKASKYASDHYNVGYSAIYKYNRSKGCVIKDLKV
jgi:hypothetical protein